MQPMCSVSKPMLNDTLPSSVAHVCLAYDADEDFLVVINAC